VNAQPPAAPRPTPAPPPIAVPKLSTQVRVQVREFRFEGNSVFSDAELAKVVAPFTGREITSEELEDARRAVTLHYVQRGFINSGAILPDQTVVDGVITFQIIEGVLTEIAVESNRWLRTSYLEGRIERYAHSPVNLVKLQEGLQILRQNPNIQQINAELKPGVKPGESILDVRVKDAQPFRFATEVANDRPPSVGAYEVRALASHMNLTGHSDVLTARYGIAHWSEEEAEWSEFDNVSGSYTLPVNSYDTSLEVHASKYDTTIIQQPFATLNITSETARFGGGIRHPIYRTPNREVAAGVSFDREESDNFLLGKSFGATTNAPGSINISVLRFTTEFLDRGLNHVLALRSTTSVGIDAFGITEKGRYDPTFVAWLGQGQYVRRLFQTANQVILRANVQWTEDSLPPQEQFALGGIYTVRGYAENQIARDRGFTTSVEFRIPVLLDKSGREIIHLAPFFDCGGTQFADSNKDTMTVLTSVGGGILINPIKYVSAVMYWGYAFRDYDVPDDEAQNLGISFRVTLQAF
jgi:hemolysin activation/secretion protein